MKNIPATKEALVLRTDFSNETAWQTICAAIQQPVGDFKAHVEFISDPAFAGLSIEQLLITPFDEANHSFLFIADHTALSHPEHPILVLDLWREPGRTFRVIPAEMCGVENNLSIANIDFAEFAEAVDSDGVFRGFPMTESQRAALHQPQQNRSPRKNNKRPASLLARVLLHGYKLLRGKPKL